MLAPRSRPLPRAVKQLQARLYFGAMPPPNPDHIPAICRDVGALPAVRPFEVYLVGSALRPRRTPKDVDLLLCRRPGRRTTAAQLLEALVAIRELGLDHYQTSLDPCFRTGRSDLLGGVLAANRWLRTWKLEDPIVSLQCQLGLIRSFRRGPRGLIVVARRAQEHSYFRKLPVHPDGGGSDCRWLEPGVVITDRDPPGAIG